MPYEDEKGYAYKLDGRNLLDLARSFAGIVSMKRGSDGGIRRVEHSFEEGETSGDVGFELGGGRLLLGGEP